MALSVTTIRELKGELIDLEGSRKVLEARISAIKSVLGEKVHVPGTPVKTNLREPERARQQLASPRKPRVYKRRPLGIMITAVMKGVPGLRPRDIAARVSDAGIKMRGKTSLSDRVHRELKRLRDRRVVARAENGTYELVREDAEGARHDRDRIVGETQ